MPHRLCAVVLATMAVHGLAAQSKKDIITAQSAVLDSITRIADQQHEAILEATDRIRQLDADLAASNKALERERMRMDSVRAASGLAYGNLLRERDSLYVQHRVVENKLRRLGNGQMGYTCVMPFSMRSLPDTLVLEAAGPDLLSAVITFRIIDWRGNEIYHTPVELQREEEIMEDEKLQRCALEARILAFFQDRRFAYPPIGAERDRQHARAVAAGERFGITPDEWDALRFDAHTCAFTFPISASESRVIAYSTQLKRVVELDAAPPGR